MANPRYSPLNLAIVEDATIYSASADANYPDDNAIDGFVAKPWRGADTSLTGQYLVIDLQSAQSIDALALLNCNFTTNATLEIRGNSAATFSSAPFTVTLDASSLSIQDNLVEFLSPAQSYRFWQFRFDDSLNASTYLEVGELWLGRYTTLTDSYNFGFRDTRESINVTHGTPFGVDWSYGRARRRIFELEWSNASEATAVELVDLWDATDGSLRAFVWVPNPDDGLTYLVRFPDSLTDSEAFYQIHNVGSIRLVEETAGLGLS